MRNVFNENSFDIVTNLFTSFGYFEDTNDEQKTINAMVKNLRKDGVLIIDFMNVKKTIINLVTKERKTIDNINFEITRDLINNYIYKNINIFDKKINLKYQEKVHALTLYDFSKMLEKAKMKIIAVFGDYQLNSFDASKSDRLILITKK